jgi:hypothetical protein
MRIKMSWSSIALIIAAAVSLVQANRDRMPLYNFLGESNSATCNVSEWNGVLQVMSNATISGNRRGLGALHHRNLWSCPAWCGKYCASMGVGCAQRGRRRYLQGSDSMDDVTPCAADITAIDTALSGYTAVSSKCQALLAGQKTVTCPFYTTTDCYIKGISVMEAWFPPRPVIPKMNATGNVWCRKHVNFLVDTTFVVGQVNMTLRYTLNETEPMKLYTPTLTKHSAPYYMYGNTLRNYTDGTVGLQINHIRFAPGWYSLQVVAVDNPSDVKTANFTVKSCF